MVKINSVVLIGRWVQDNDLKVTKSGVYILNNTIAVDRQFSKDKEADFFDVTAFGKVAENTANYTGKGRLIGIAGRLQQDKWTSDTGIKKTKVVVIANSIEFLDYADSQKSNESDTGTGNYEDFRSADDSMDEIPF